jgi:hypothetical protein
MTPEKLRETPLIINLLSRMPASVADSFNDEQLSNLLIALASRGWGKHAIDLRGTLRIPFYRRRFYYVLLLGRNYRELSRQEIQISIFGVTLMFSIFLGGCMIFGLLALYLIKSALGIDIFPGFSLGIWDWFKSALG